MAAHGLTIMNQGLRRIAMEVSTDALAQWIQHALNAPGTGVYFSGLHWSKLMDAAESGDRDRMVTAITEARDHHLWMRGYSCHEAIVAADELYVRWRTPYWKRRFRAFYDGGETLHKTLQAELASRYPHRFPAVLVHENWKGLGAPPSTPSAQSEGGAV